MPTVRYSDGTEFYFPEPKGENIRQLAKRHNYLQLHYKKCSKEQLEQYVDDMIYLLLDYWKAHNIKEPFNQLYRLVEENQLTFRIPDIQEVFYRRVKEVKELIELYKTESGEKKEEVKKELKKRGFIGGREIEQL